MKSRRQAREAALQALYQCDSLEEWGEDGISLFFEVFCAGVEGGVKGDVKGDGSDQTSEHLLFAKSLVMGVAANLSSIDSRISAASTRWSLKRMPRVDRNVLRLGVYELFFMDDIPVNVTINEAIEIAKKYGTDDSQAFVNGILDRLASDTTERKQQRA